MKQSKVASLGLALLLSTLPMTNASAHVVMTDNEARAGWQERVSLMVPHGCGESPTTEIRVKVPEGTMIAMMEDVPGWTSEVVMKELEVPSPMEGGAAVLTKVPDEFIWSGGTLANDRVAVFPMMIRFPDQPGKVVYFKTIQTCADGTIESWVETAEEGEEIWQIYMNDRPSPFVELYAPRRPQLGLTVEEFIKRKAALRPDAPTVE